MKNTESARPLVNLRRAYLESRYGQLHVRTAFPSTGGFDEHIPLVCLHSALRSSRSFRAFLPEIATDRSVYACDTPGSGESDPPPAAPALAAYAAAIGDFLDSLRLRQVDVVGVHTGSAIAAELAILRPQGVRRLVLVGVPMPNTVEREAFGQAPWPAVPAEDGSHLLREWQRLQAARGPGVSLEQLSEEFAEQLHGGASAAWALAATYGWPGRERLPLVTQPTLVLRPRDELWEATLRAQPLLKQATCEDLPTLGAGCFDTAPGPMAARIRRYLGG